MSTTVRRWQVATTVAAVALGTIVLFLAITEEPYHVDELRQVSSYSHDLKTVVEASIGQEQPPLDAVLNAIAQRAIGVGDFQQRLLSVLFGIGSLALMGALTLRNGFGWGSPVTVIVLALSPLLVSVTAYARPYALPLFLILALILSIDVWLGRPSIIVGILIPAIALLLPLSRTLEPNLALASIAATLILGRRVLRAKWTGTIWVPVGSTLTALVLVGGPMILMLRGELERYTQAVPLQTKISRLATDLPSVLADTTPWWPVVLLVVLAAIAIRPSRRRLTGSWWTWVLVSIPFGFAVIFFSQARVSIPYFDRYASFWWAPIALFSGALVSGILDVSRMPSTTTRSVFYKRTVQVVGSGAVVLSVLGLGIGLRNELLTAGRADWAAASLIIEQATPNTAIIIYERARPIGAYRPRFYGQPRYLESSRSVVDTGRLMRNPTQIEGSQSVGLLLEGSSPEIPGFSRQQIDGYFTLYLPTKPLIGPTGAATTLLAAAASLSPTTGSHSALVAATILAADGEATKACELVDSYSLLSGERAERTHKQIEQAGEFGVWIGECRATPDPGS